MSDGGKDAKYMTTTAQRTPSPPTSAASLSTIGERFGASPAVHAAIDSLVKQAAAHSAMLTDVRPPQADLKESYDALMASAADVRGRGLLYPYLGSGIGNGALVELLDGSVKWDMITGIGVHLFGHSDTEMIEAGVRGALADTFQHGNLMSNTEAYRFGEVLLAEAKKHSRLKYAYCSTSGCMANENAVKVCYQKHQPANRVIAFKDCFMGRSVTMCQIGDTAAYREGIPLSTLVDYMPFYDPAVAARMGGENRFIDVSVMHLRQYIERYPKQHACFIFELIQGEGGFNTAPREYFVELMKVCKEANIAVWDDEIQSFGRTERMFAYELLNVGEYVDVFCVGKMTQVCATLYTEEYNPQAGLLSGTFTSSTPAFNIGTRVIERLRDGGYYGPEGLIAKHHAAFSKQVRALASRHPEWFPKGADFTDVVGGAGGMMRITPFGGKKDKIAKLCKHLFDEGVVAFYCGHGPYHVRMLPPLGVMREGDWPRVFACIERGMASAAAEG